MTINDIQDELIEDFSFFDDWMAKYEHIIHLGQELQLTDGPFKVDEYLMKGFQSKVWLDADHHDVQVIFTADSDALITNGLLGHVVKVMSGHTPTEIATSDLHLKYRRT